MEFSEKQMASNPQLGNDIQGQELIEENGIVKMMIKFNIPLTRQNYLDLAYMGDVPEELSAEEEAEIPEEFQINNDKPTEINEPELPPRDIND